jgi:hypothetical protein
MFDDAGKYPDATLLWRDPIARALSDSEPPENPAGDIDLSELPPERVE